jgi:hypothetical protein
MDPQEMDLLAERIADEVATRLRDRPAVRPLMTASEVALYLQVEVQYVYSHAAELGGRKLPGGPKGRLRFALGDLEAGMSSGSGSGGSLPPEPSRQANSGSRRRKRSGVYAQMAVAELLPVRGKDPRDLA